MQQPSAPIVVKVVEPTVRGLGLGDTILNAIGLTGVIVVAAVLLGLALAGAVILLRRARAQRMTDEEASQTQSLGL